MPQICDLGSADWQFGSVPRRRFDAPSVNDWADVAEWLPACVPGNVRNDLLVQGRIEDPFFGDGYRSSLWVDSRDWWYCRALDMCIDPGQRAFLIFHGIDYLSAVFLNDLELGRHEGMFSRQVYEITDFLTQGSAQLAVRLWGSDALPRRRLNPLERVWRSLTESLYPELGAFPDRMATLKCQMSFGWDFAPPIRTIGIWDDVWLVVTEGVFIEDVWIQSQLSEPTGRQARLAVELTVDSDQPRSAQAGVQVCPANFKGSDFGPLSFEVDLPAGRSTHALTIDLPYPQLWWPWDRGFPYLYKLVVTLHPSAPPGPGGARPLASASTRFGIRHITLDKWTFTINDQREFIRGLNWVPADSLPGRLRRDDYAELLGMARAAGVNLLRVWGGGLREKRAFYDLCDELGLLVWQEFPFACAFLDYFPRDPNWLRLAERECTAIVRETRNHSSIALWCAGNEFSPRRNRSLVRTLARLVEVQDGTRPFLPGSPSPGDAHNWDVWHGRYPLQAYQGEDARFLSEFGLQAVPSIETLRACLPKADVWPPGAGWEVHKAELSKLWRYVRSIHSPQGRRAGEEGETTLSLESFSTASQQVQALGLQFAIEHMRRRKGETDGVCLWQFNEPWPAISWAIVDYWRRPKLAYQRLKDLYNPVLIGLTFPAARYQPSDIFDAEVWAVNDSLEALDDCWLQIELDLMKIYDAEITLPPDSALVVGKLCHRLCVEPRKLKLTLQQGGRVIACNAYDLTYHDPTLPSWRDRLVRWLADAALR